MLLLTAVNCALAEATVPGLACAENPNGVILAPTPERAQELAVYAQGGEVRFERHFGQAPARYAIVEIGDPQRIGAQLKALNAAGFRRTLPHLSRTAYGEALMEGMQMLAEANAQAQGLSGESRRRVIEAEMASARASLSPYAMDDLEETVVPHEIGHGWYTEAYWPDAVLDGGGHYGSPSPDWLDETAAILMESGDSAEERRTYFREGYLGLSANPASALADLKKFLTQEHPGKGPRPADTGLGDGAPVVQVVPKAEDAAAGDTMGIFYAQARMFADYLIDRSGDPAIFASMAAAFAKGRGIHAWLADSGSAKGLPVTLDALHADWRAWLAARFGAMRSRRPD